MTLESYCSSLYGGVGMSPTVDPLTIPCNETSCPEKLCKRPLVSVRLITYNHEQYIREAINSVLAQEADFEYELVIGEDCSSDRTREICFEYQKRFPEKVRVLWADVNVRSLGGNAARCTCRCRGKYIALLEGDDYWTDIHKLQKQVQLISDFNVVGCVASYETRNCDGIFSRSEFRCVQTLSQRDLFHFYPHTSTYIFRTECFSRIWKDYPNVRGRYDVAILHCMAELGKIAYLCDSVSVYRLTGQGMATSQSEQQKKLTAVKIYLDLYLHGPKSVQKRFGALVITYAAFFHKKDQLGWSQCLTKAKTHELQSLVLELFVRQLFDLRTLCAMARYIRYRFYC